MNTRLLTPIEAAARLCVSTRSLMRLVRDAAIPHVVLPGGEVRFDRDDLEAWVERRRVNEEGHVDGE